MTLLIGHAPPTLFRPSPTNPRTKFDPGYIKQLARSIDKHDVMQPVLVRPAADAPAGAPPHEIVVGECRWRAVALLREGFDDVEAKAAELPFIVRELSDFEAAEMQLIENVQRNDLHPLEEAVAYQRMLADPSRPAGYGVADLAAHIGKDERYVKLRLKLLDLCEPAREAFLAEKLTDATALLVARVPDQAVQAEIVRHITTWGGEPMGKLAAAKFIRERYMLRLAAAPFDPKDAKLVPAAGACGSCHKRTGANPQLFDDIGDADTCTDPACYAGKKQALRDRNVQAQRDAGHQVLQGDAARQVCASGGHGLKPGLLALTANVPFAMGDASLTVQAVLEQASTAKAAIVAIDHPEREDIIFAASTEVVESALKQIKASRRQLDAKAKRAQKPPAAPAPSSSSAAPAKAASNAGAKPEAAAEPDADAKLLEELCDFDIPATSGGKYHGLSAEKFAAEKARRVRGVLIAHAVVRQMQEDGAEGMPTGPELAKMVIVGCRYGDGWLSLAQAARLAQIDPPPKKDLRAEVEWVWELDDEPAYQVAMAMLAAQESGGADGFERFPDAVATLVDINTRGLAERAEQIVKERMQLAAVKLGALATKKKPAATKKPKAETKAPKPATKKPKAEPAGAPADAEDRSPIPLKNGSTLSPVAAWPFPTGKKP